MEWDAEIKKRLEEDISDEERRELINRQHAIWDAFTPEEETRQGALSREGWKVEIGLSGYVVINPEGEMEWWRGVSTSVNQAWKHLIRFPDAVKPSLGGANEIQRREILRLFNRHKTDQ